MHFLEGFANQLTPRKKLVLDQITELYKAGYITEQDASALATKHTDVLRVEIMRRSDARAARI